MLSCALSSIINLMSANCVLVDDDDYKKADNHAYVQLSKGIDE